MNLSTSIYLMGAFLLGRTPIALSNEISLEQDDIGASTKPQLSTLEATTTLHNFKGGTFSPEETEFFDRTFQRAWETVHFHDHNVVTNVRVEKSRSTTEGNGRRALRRGLNGPSTPEQQTHESSSPTPEQQQISQDKQKPKTLDLLLLVDWYCEDDKCEQEEWFRRRLIRGARRELPKTNQQHRKFEILLCQMLRSGPHKSLEDVEGCTVTVG